MNLILTSYGISQDNNVAKSNFFYRMPPVDMYTSSNKFQLDFAALLLCKKIILDEETFYMLQDEPHIIYTDVAKSMRILKDEGFVKLANFTRILEDNQLLLKKMLEWDLQLLDSWVSSLRESREIWEVFALRAMNRICGSPVVTLTSFPPAKNWVDELGEASLLLLSKVTGSDVRNILNKHPSNMVPASYYLDEAFGPEYKNLQAPNRIRLLLDTLLDLKKTRRRALVKAAFEEVLKAYLLDINANLVLSNELEVGFYDWADYSPFYRQKFLTVGTWKKKEEQQVDVVQQLFRVSFPEYHIQDAKPFVKALQDKRVEDLRQLVQDVAEGKVNFDDQFAKNVFKEVLYTERQAQKYKNIVSYLTMPLDILGFLPGIGGMVQKGVEEAVGAIIDRKIKKKHQWFYLLEDISSHTSHHRRLKD